jgi:hypothetical protein
VKYSVRMTDNYPSTSEDLSIQAHLTRIDHLLQMLLTATLIGKNFDPDAQGSHPSMGTALNEACMRASEFAFQWRGNFDDHGDL